MHDPFWNKIEFLRKVGFKMHSKSIFRVIKIARFHVRSNFLLIVDTRISAFMMRTPSTRVLVFPDKNIYGIVPLGLERHKRCNIP